MTLILALLVQAAADDGLPLPRLSDLEYRAPRATVEDFMGVEAFALWTRWDDGIHIDDHWGIGADLEFGWDYGVFRQAISLGFAGWGSDTDDLPDAGVDIRQYRLGYALSFRIREVLELGGGITTGVYRFRRRNENDTSPYVEFEGSIGFRPLPMVRLGVLGLATHTQSSFNRSHTHLFHNYSAGPFVEVSF
jgi:hypothetical protein